MIAAQTGTSIAPARRSRPSTSVAFGYVETTTSGRASRIARRRPADPQRVRRCWVAARVARGPVNSQKLEIRDPLEVVEDDRGGVRADGAHGPPHGGARRVERHDLDAVALGHELRGETPRGRVVPLPDAGGEDEDAQADATRGRQRRGVGRRGSPRRRLEVPNTTSHHGALTP